MAQGAYCYSTASIGCHYWGHNCCCCWEVGPSSRDLGPIGNRDSQVAFGCCYFHFHQGIGLLACSYMGCNWVAYFDKGMETVDLVGSNCTIIAVAIASCWDQSPYQEGKGSHLPYQDWHSGCQDCSYLGYSLLHYCYCCRLNFGCNP